MAGFPVTLAKLTVPAGCSIASGGQTVHDLARLASTYLGLSEGVRAEVSGLYSRAAPARSTGRTVAKRLVEQSRGALRADSGEGQGTTFVVVLPRYTFDDYLL